MAAGFEGRQLLIRADVGAQVGLGHVLRMLALAQAWKDAGGEVTLCSTALGDSILDRWEEEGMRWVRLPGDVECNSIHDARFTAAEAQERGCGVVVLDGYGFGLEYLKALRANGDAHLVKIVDAPPPDGELSILDGVVYPGLAQVNPQVPKLLAGPDYVLLRREFREAKPPNRSKQISRLCLCMGGTDPGNYLSKIAGEMWGYKDRLAGLREVRVVTTSGNPHLSGLRDALAQAADCPWRWELCLDVRDMVQVLCGVDAVVSSASGIAWEWLSLGVRGAVLAVASNQQRFYEGLVEAGYAVGLGMPWKEGGKWNREGFMKWIEGGGIVACCPSEPLSPVDGKGAVRVCAFLAKLMVSGKGV
jgi:UDP-2,4-diacetamido-2,4,6-trideoxy-beta-L-altropyranose hydrolase